MHLRNQRSKTQLDKGTQIPQNYLKVYFRRFDRHTLM